jgi:hypothetical protein
MSRLQQLLNIFELGVSAPEWDVLADANFDNIAKYLHTWELTEEGDTVSIQMQNVLGEDVEEECFLRVRICDGTDFAVSSDSYFNVTTGTVVEEILTDKDVIIQSNATGLIEIELGLGVTTTPLGASTQPPIVGIIRIGPPPVGARIGDYSNSLSVS